MVVAKFLCHATVHTNFLEKKTLKEKNPQKTNAKTSNKTISME